jgi:hypothetical protein
MTQDVTSIIDLSNSQEMANWNREMSGAIEIEGYSQYGGKENERALDALIGIPFLILHATFRQGDIIPTGLDAPRDYVSAECLVHPMHAARFARKYVIFNDGSTGIYRQIVAALAARDLIELDENLPETGDAHATRYDVSFSDDEHPSVEFRGIRIFCPEGLRKSEYPNPAGGGKSVTWYLA